MNEPRLCFRGWRLAALGLIALTASSLCRAAEDGLILVKSELSGAGVFVDDDTEPRGQAAPVRGRAGSSTLASVGDTERDRGFS